MQLIEQRKSNIIGAVSFVCAILVVTIHADVSPAIGSLSSFIMLAIRCVNKIAVPFFFLFSGYFLAGRMAEEGWYGVAVRKRVFSLIVPFYLWMILYQLLNAVLVWLAGRLGSSFGAETFSLSAENALYLVGLHPFKLAPIVWYLRSLFLLVLMSPILARLNRRGLLLVCVIAFCLWAMHEVMPYRGSKSWSFFEYFLSLKGLCFFSIGIFIRKTGKGMPGWGVASWIAHILSIGEVAIVVAGLLPLHTLVPFFVLPMMYSIWIVISWLVDHGWLSGRLQKYCMPIYLMHLPWLIIVTGVFTIMGLKAFCGTSIFAFAIKSAVVILTSILSYQLLREKASPIMFGGRR